MTQAAKREEKIKFSRIKNKYYLFHCVILYYSIFIIKILSLFVIIRSFHELNDVTLLLFLSKTLQEKSRRVVR